MSNPARWILATPTWQRGYDLAIEQSGNHPPAELANPFGLRQDEFYGFEAGRDDAEKLQVPPCKTPT